MAFLLLAATTSPAHADCPAAPIADPDDMAISFLAANGVQAGSASLHASTIKEGIVVYDDANDTLKLCDGNNWIAVGSGSGTDTLGALSCSSGEIAKFNGTAWACAADGGGSTSSALGFFVHKNGTNQTVSSGSFQKLTWNTEMFDIGDHFSSDRFTPTVAGRYVFSLNVYCTNSPSWCHPGLFKNGVIVSSSAGANVGGQGNSTTAVIDMNGTTDYVEAYIYNYGTIVSGVQQYTFFSGALVGGGSDTLASLSCSSGQIPKWNGSAWACATDGGGGGTEVAFSAHNNDVNQTVTASQWTKLSLSTEEFDTNNNFSSSRFTPTVAGKYLVTLTTGCQGGTWCYPAIFKNGSVYMETWDKTADGSDTITALVDMNGTSDYVEGYIYNYGGTLVYGNVYYTRMAGFRTGGSAGSDTLAGLSCATNEIPKWNGSTWACAADGGGSGGGAASYLHASGPAKSNVAAGTVLPFDNTYDSVGADVLLNTSNNRFTLKAGKTYRLMAQSMLSNTSPAGALWFGWYDVTNSAAIGSSGYSITADIATTYSTIPMAVAYITPSVDTNVELRISYASPATTIDVYMSNAWIETIGGGGADTLSGLSCATNEIPKWNGTAWACADDDGVGAGSTMVSGWPDAIICTNGSATEILFNNWTDGTFRTYASPYDGSGTRRYIRFNVSGQTYNAHQDLAAWDCVTGTKSIAQLYSEGRAFNFIGGGSSQWTDVSGGINYAGGKVGIGTTTPEASLVTVDTAVGTPRGIVASQYNTGVQGALFIGKKARGAPGSEAGVEANDYLVALQGLGHNGSAFPNPQSVVTSRASELWTTTSNATMLGLWTTPSTSIVAQERLRIDSTGGVSIGSGADANASSLLDLTSTTRGFLPPRMTTTQRDAITSPAEGLVVYNTTTKSLDLRIASSWLSFGGSMTGNTMVSGWPDAIKCNVTNPAWGPVIFYAELMPLSNGLYYYRNHTNSGNHDVIFDGSGAFNGYSTITATSDCGAGSTIAGLYSAGKAFNFVGGGGSSQWTTNGSDIYYNTGEVGIGVTNPVAKIHAVGSGASTDIVRLAASTGDQKLVVREGSDNSIFLRLYDGGNTETIRLNPSSTSWLTGGRVGIGTTSPNATALLDLASTTQGFLPPRMTTTERDAISSPATGLVIYNTTRNAVEYYTGAAWASGGGKTKLCLENDNCSGTPVLCGATVAGSDGSNQPNTVLSSNSTIQFGAWTNAPCGASGSGWSAVNGTCGGGTGSARVRCNWVLVEEAGGGTAMAAGDGGQVQFNDGSDVLAADAALHWDNTNKRLGIGTAAPQKTLDLRGEFVIYPNTQNVGSRLISRSINPDGRWALDVRGTSGGSDTQLVVARDGFIGFGQGEFSSSNLNAAIGVSGNLAFIPKLRIGGSGLGPANISGMTIGASSSTEWLNGGSYPSGANHYFIKTVLDSVSSAERAPLRISAHDLSFWTGAAEAERMRIDHNGNVGIGTATPQRPLHVQVNAAGSPTMLALENLDTSGSTAVISHRITTTGAGASTFVEATGIQMKTVEHDHATRASQLSFWTAANGVYSNRMIIDGSGNVGIGTPTPGQKLHVSGTGGDTYVRIDTASSAHAAGIHLTAGAISNYGSILVHRASDNGLLLLNSENGPVILGVNETEMMRISSTGNVGMGTPSPGYKLDINGTVRATTYLYASDRRLKTDIKTTSGLDLVSRMHGVSFRWKDTGKAATGVIAQEIEEVLPHAVSTDDAGSKSVDYPQLIGPLIEAIKELKADNDNLRAELKAANDNHEVELDELRTEIEAIKGLTSEAR